MGSKLIKLSAVGWIELEARGAGRREEEYMYNGGGEAKAAEQASPVALLPVIATIPNVLIQAGQIREIRCWRLVLDLVSPACV